MCCSIKIDVSQRKAIREQKMACHRSIQKEGNAIQLQKHYLKEPLPILDIVPKINLGVVLDLETRTSRKLLQPPPNEFLDQPYKTPKLY
jgi:chaperone required for assembly of F1-ATPase